MCERVTNPTLTQRGRKSRNKGARGEREFAALCREHGYAEAVRTAQHAGKNGGQPDVKGLPGVHVEVKRTEALRLYDAVDQAKRDAPAGRLRAVAHRKNNAEWLIIMPAEDWFEIYREWEAGKQPEQDAETTACAVRAYDAPRTALDERGINAIIDYVKRREGDNAALWGHDGLHADDFRKFLRRMGLCVRETGEAETNNEPALSTNDIAREIAAERALGARHGVDWPRCKICLGKLRNTMIGSACPYCGHVADREGGA